MPPNYNELPLPKTENKQTDSEESKIKELLTKEKNENNIKNTEDLNKSFEDMLLEKIKKKLMLTKGINFKNYKLKIKSSNLVFKLNTILKEKNEVLNS